MSNPALEFRPDVTVATVVERDGRFLMVEETAAGRRVFNQPAGHLEPDESLVEAAIRETLEETAWRISVDALLGLYLWQSPVDQKTFLRVAFAGSCCNHEATRQLDEGIIRAIWLNRSEIGTLGPRLRSPLVLRCLDDYLAGVRHPLSLLSHLESMPLEVCAEASR